MEELIASVKVVEDEEGLVAYARMLFFNVNYIYSI
jgi:hypothetical protein